MRHVAKLFIVAFAFTLIIGLAAPALFATPSEDCHNWTASITVSSSIGGDSVVFGVKPTATGGYDNGIDIVKPPEPMSPYVYAHFYYSGNAGATNKLYASYIAPAASENWDNLRIKCVNDDDPTTPIDITLTWDISNLPTKCSAYLYYKSPSLILVADMRAVPSYTYSATPGLITTFKIVVICPEEPGPGAPELISPENCHDIFDNTPTFMWTPVNDPSGVTYEIQIDNGVDLIMPDFLLPVYDVAGIPINTYTLPDENALQICVHYWWRVRATNGLGSTGPWSEPWHFHVVPVGAIGALLLSLFLLLPFALMVRHQNRRYHY
jgi:hypothetical protein